MSVCVRFDVAVFYVNAKTRNFREVRDKLECVTGGNITRLVYTTRLRARDGTGCARRRTRTTAPRPILAAPAQTEPIRTATDIPIRALSMPRTANEFRSTWRAYGVLAWRRAGTCSSARGCAVSTTGATSARIGDRGGAAMHRSPANSARSEIVRLDIHGHHSSDVATAARTRLRLVPATASRVPLKCLYDRANRRRHYRVVEIGPTNWQPRSPGYSYACA